MSLEPACAESETLEFSVSVECQRVKVEWEEETDGQQESELHIKVEPEWTGGLTSSLKCVVKGEGGLLDLYAGHKVEEDLVLGPEGPQLPDSAFALPTCADSSFPNQVELTEEPNTSVSLEQSAGHNVTPCGRGSGKPEPDNQIKMKQSPASFPFDQQLKVCSVDRPHASKFPSNSSLTTKPHPCERVHKIMSNYYPYRWCIVPECKNTSVRTPGKLWIQVPTHKELRYKWLDLCRTDSKSLSSNTRLYFCEDHFDMENDMENYIQYKIMGSVKKIRMKPDCVPSIFKCQGNVKRKSSEPDQNAIAKRRNRNYRI